MNKELVCIMCPMGCHLNVKKVKENFEVTGNGCIRGEIFAKEEMTCPKRVLTTLVKTEQGVKSCKTTAPVEKDKIFDCIKEIEKLRLKKVEFGQVIIKNILNTGADVVVTSND